MLAAAGYDFAIKFDGKPRGDDELLKLASQMG